MKRGAILASFLIALLFTPLVLSQGAAQHAIGPRFVDGAYTSVQPGSLVPEVEAFERFQFNAGCSDRAFQKPRSVSDWVGEAATEVRVLRVDNDYLPKEQNPLDLLKEAWNGRSDAALCFIYWSEPVGWSVEGAVRFVDGKEGRVVTDGQHIAFQDQYGTSYFLVLNEKAADVAPTTFSADSYQMVSWLDLETAAEGQQAPDCLGRTKSFYPAVPIADFVGGRAISIRVTRVASVPLRDSPETILRRAWSGKIQDPGCQIMWSEVTTWSIEATVEFEDGKHAKVITDGYHIAFQDHSGKTWFDRVLPAGP